jgi:hypothetical protein
LSVDTRRDTHVAPGATDSIGMLRLTELCDGDNDMMDEIPARVTRLFGSDKARPKVVRVYNAGTGWAAADGTPRASWEVLDELRRQGATSAEAKWRFQTHQFSILDMKHPAQDGGAAGAEPSGGQGRRGRGIEN